MTAEECHVAKANSKISLGVTFGQIAPFMSLKASIMMSSYRQSRVVKWVEGQNNNLLILLKIDI